jgi:hypothetical protein
MLFLLAFVLFLLLCVRVKRALGRAPPQPHRPPLTVRAFARMLADLKRTTERRPTSEGAPTLDHGY